MQPKTHTVTVRKGQPTRTLHLGHYPKDHPERRRRGKPRTRTVRAGQTFLCSAEDAALIAADVQAQGLGNVIKITELPKAAVPNPRRALGSPARQRLQQTLAGAERTTMADLVAEFEQAGVAVPPEVAALKRKADLVAALTDLLPE